MRTRILGRTGIDVSEVGFGAWAIGGPATLGDMEIGWGKVEDEESIAALEAALDAGINFFDTADVYGAGHSEELVAKAFAAKRGRVVIAGKFGNRVIKGEWIKQFDGAYAVKAIEASLRRLKTDYIDLIQLHSPPVDHVFGDELWKMLDKLVAQGKIRHYGVSVSQWEQGFKVIDAAKPETIQVIFSILDPAPAQGGLLAKAKQANVAIIPRVPLASGFLTGKFGRGHTFAADDHRSSMTRQEIDSRIDKAARLRPIARERGQTMAQLALSWILSHDAVSVVIPGAKTVHQVKDNAAAGEAPLLSDEEMREIAEIV